MEKVAFSFGILTFHWYGLIIALAVLAGLGVTLWQARIYQEPMEPAIDLVIYGVPIVIILSRIYYVLVNYSLFLDNPLEVLYIWHGGLAIHGALLGMLLVLYFYTRLHHLSFWKWADIVAPGMVFGQALGQWGNFINQEAFGYPTSVPWAIYIDYVYRPAGYEQFDFFHPTFLYSFGWNFFVFLLLLGVVFYRFRFKKLRNGNVFLLYLCLYSLGKFCIEELRLDSEMYAGLRIAQIISAVAILISLLFFFRINRIKSEDAPEKQS